MNSVPASVAELTVTAEVPEDVSVKERLELVFKVTFPNASAPELTLKFGELDETPVPLKYTLLKLPLDESLKMVMVPLAVPASVGLNPTCRVRDCPGLRVAGKTAPDNVNCAPASTAELTVTGEVPEDVSVNGSLELEFKVTFPKASAPELTLKFGERDETPVPLRDTVLEMLLDESLKMVMVPLAVPAAVGLKAT